jgi:hypothetical protein
MRFERCFAFTLEERLLLANKLKRSAMLRYEPKLALAVLCVVFLSSAQARAQGMAPYSPYPTPAMSPWFNLYNKQGGPLDNYNMFVRPEMQLRSTLQTQQFDIQQQNAGATTLSQQVSQFEENRREVQPTGAPAGFMNQGRFFGVQSTTGQGISGLGTARPLHSNTVRQNWSLPTVNTHAGQ